MSQPEFQLNQGHQTLFDPLSPRLLHLAGREKCELPPESLGLTIYRIRYTL
jgi:hypothetical protein